MCASLRPVGDTGRKLLKASSIVITCCVSASDFTSSLSPSSNARCQDRGLHLMRIGIPTADRSPVFWDNHSGCQLGTSAEPFVMSAPDIAQRAWSENSGSHRVELDPARGPREREVQNLVKHWYSQTFVSTMTTQAPA